MATNTVKKTKMATRTTEDKVKAVSVDFPKRIEEKAYEFFTRRGCVHGNDILDWTLAQDLVELENKAASSKKLRKADVKSRELKEEIEKRAYKLYEYRGRAYGNDIFDWSLAEEIAFLRSNIC